MASLKYIVSFFSNCYLTVKISARITMSKFVKKVLLSL